MKKLAPTGSTHNQTRERTRSRQSAPRQRMYTLKEFCEVARQKGFEATGRLVLDWIEKGLLDRTTPVYRRGKRGYLPEQQLQLFLTVLEHRRKTPTAKKIWGLLNIPVWVWLRWGDEYVPLRQVRRALKTWADVMKRGDTRRNALKAARALADRLGHSASPKGGRPLVSVRKLADLIQQGQLDEERFAATVRTLSQRKPRGNLTMTSQQPGTSSEQVVKLISARYEAIIHLDEIDDATFEAARKFYLETYPLYLRSAHGTVASPETAEPMAEESLHGACLDLVTTLGLIRRGVVVLPVTPPPVPPQRGPKTTKEEGTRRASTRTEKKL